MISVFERSVYLRYASPLSKLTKGICITEYVLSAITYSLRSRQLLVYVVLAEIYIAV